MHPDADPAPAAPAHAALADVLVVACVTAAFFLFSIQVELAERVAAWTRSHESWQLDEVPLVLVVLCTALAWFGWRRLRERTREMKVRLRVEAQMQRAMQKNRELTHYLLRLQEEERGRIARELHDAMAQQCVAIRVEAAGIEQEAQQREQRDMAAGAHAIRETVDSLQGAVRDMLRWLRPPMLDAVGLETSLRALTRAWSQRHGIVCTLQVAPACDRLPDEVRVALYRVIQEALTNAAQHSGASQVQLVLEWEPDGQVLALTVDDDGRGMADTAQHGGIGLLGMAERMALLGGSLALGPSPRGGLRVAARLPLAQHSDAVGAEVGA
jgi:signal transduction histidine kinase